MKKTVKELKGTLSVLDVKKNGQHVGILNTENLVEGCVYYETESRPMVGDNFILPPSIRQELAFHIHKDKDVYFGIIYPEEKKFNQGKWNEDLIAQELANFTTVSKVTHWGRNTYIHLTRDIMSEELELLFSTAYNWTD